MGVKRATSITASELVNKYINDYSRIVGVSSSFVVIVNYHNDENNFYE